jgi:hypothetical protein
MPNNVLPPPPPPGRNALTCRQNFYFTISPKIQFFGKYFFIDNFFIYTTIHNYPIAVPFDAGRSCLILWFIGRVIPPVYIILSRQEVE